MTREEASKILRDMLPGPIIPPVHLGSQKQEAIQVALTALRPVSREQVEKVWPGCPYCKEDGEGYVKKFGAYSILDGEVTTGHCKPQKIKFCPHCSCPLTDEAVEIRLKELEALWCE